MPRQFNLFIKETIMTTRMKVFKIWLDWNQISEKEPDVHWPAECEEYLVFGYRDKSEAIRGFIAAGLADYEFGELERERFVSYIKCETVDLYEQQCVSIKNIRHVPIQFI
jgi:hypothetical protein